MVIVTGTAPINPASRDQMIEAATAVREASLQEPGCLRYDVAFDLADPNLMHIFEEWADQDALDQHFAAPHLAQFMEVLPTALAGEPSIHMIVGGEKQPMM